MQGRGMTKGCPSNMPTPTLKSRASGRWTEARFWQFLRSALRQASIRWPPKADAMRAARRPYDGANPRQKWEYLCADCGAWCMGKNVAAHHVEPCGTLRSYSDLPAFVRREFCEVDGYEVLCQDCHKDKHTKRS